MSIQLPAKPCRLPSLPAQQALDPRSTPLYCLGAAARHCLLHSSDPKATHSPSTPHVRREVYLLWSLTHSPLSCFKCVVIPLWFLTHSLLTHLKCVVIPLSSLTGVTVACLMADSESAATERPATPSASMRCTCVSWRAIWGRQVGEGRGERQGGSGRGSVVDEEHTCLSSTSSQCLSSSSMDAMGG